MPKRSAEEKIEYYNAQIKKLRRQKKAKKHRRVIVYSSSSDSEENLENGTQPMEVHDDAPLQADASAATSTTPPPPPPPPLTPSQLVTSADDIAPSAGDVSAESPPDLDPELLQALGDAFDDVPVYGPEIHDKLAQRWLPILKKGLQPDVKAKLLKEYTFPDNCRLLKAPTLNPEISAAVAEISRNRDKKMQSKQDQLGLGITAINKAMSLLLTSGDKIQAIKTLSDGCRLLTDLHFTETTVRKKLLLPGLDKSFATVIQGQDRDETLFGNTLSEKIKASKAIEKQGLQIKKPPPKPVAPNASSSAARPRHQGNWSGPPRFQPSSSSRGARTAPYRSQYRHPPAAAAPPSSRPSTSTSAPTNKRAATRQ